MKRNGKTEEEFLSYVKQFENALLRYAVRLLWPDESGGRDLVQDTFVKFHIKICAGKTEFPENPGGWLFRVLHNLAMDALRRRKRRKRLEENMKEDPVVTRLDSERSSHTDQLERKEICDLALEEVHMLPEEQKQVLLLKHIQGMTLREISEVTGMKIGTVNYRLTQGLAELASRFRAKELMP